MSSTGPRVVFMGTSRFAVPSLEALPRAGFEVVAVVTQPSRPAGRGRQFLAPPVAEAAVKMGIPIFSPERLKTPEAVEQVADLLPDLVIVAAYAQILPRAILDLPRHGCVNVHASLLPRWRGASPIHSAILAGDELTGVTIMLMEPSMDTGPILAQTAIRIDDSDTTPVLEERLARAGAELLVDILPCHLNGGIEPVSQDSHRVTYAPLIKKEHGQIDWSATAVQIWRANRAFHSWPGTFTYWEGRQLKVVSCIPEDAGGGVSHEPGMVLALSGSGAIGVATGEGVLRLIDVAPEGGRAMTIKEFVAGHRSFVGSLLGRRRESNG